jgi:ribosomal protein L11 methyltransferase
MAWLQLEAELGDRSPELVELLLEELGAVSISLRDAGDNPLLEPKPGETPVWPSVVLTALFPEDIGKELLSSALREQFGLDELRFEQLADRNWQAEFTESLEPLRFGQRLWVIPDETTQLPENAAELVLEPGLAFGTGKHPTTAMCLEWLELQELEDRHVLDYGCGSGILGLAAARLGAASVCMTDIDEQALIASRENAGRNRLEERAYVTFPDKIEESVQFDVLVANILSGTLIELGPRLDRLMRSGATMAITGILAEQAEDVTKAWSGWADMTVTMQVREWVLLAGNKR